MQLKFLFPKDHLLTDKDTNKCKKARSVCDAVGEHLSLPDVLTIEFCELSNSNYADSLLKHGSEKHIRMNMQLELNDILTPLVHELIHVNQMHEGRLMIAHDSIYVWDTVPYEIIIEDIPYKEYLMLPWELDVAHRQPKLMQEILKSYK